jgi:hypothetical protein
MITQDTAHRTVLKVYLNEKREGTIICPSCEKSKIMSFTKFQGVRDPLKVKCTCGILFKIILEVRSYYRKSTQLQGNYTTPGTDKAGSMIVENLSLNGIGFRTRLQHNLQVGEIIDLHFELDNNVRSEILKQAVVRRVDGQFVGAKFCDLKAFDKELGYYLMPA